MPESKPKRPWRVFQYVGLIVLAVLVVYFVVRPLGEGITGVFQRLTDAFQYGK